MSIAFPIAAEASAPRAIARADALWHPPRGVDATSPVARSLWSWMLGQSWIVRFEEWEGILERPDEAHADLLAAGEGFLGQYERLWGLDWHWDGLQPPARFSDADWSEWYRRFKAWIAPWWRRQELGQVEAVAIRVPSDVLWLLRLSETRRVAAVCAHAAATAVVRRLVPDVRCTLGECDDEMPAGFVRVRTGAKDLARVEERVRLELRGRPDALFRIETWDDGWLARARLPDRLLFDLFRCRRPWRDVTDADREQLRAMGRWMNSPLGATLAEPARRSRMLEPPPARARLTTHDLAQPEYAGAVNEQLAGLTPEQVPLMPTAADWRAIHHHLLHRTYPFAGRFRRSEYSVTAGRSATVQATHIEFEMEAFHAQWQAAWSAAKSPGERLAAIAWAHLRFQRLHPFPDGNGHLGRIWLARQALEFGRAFEPAHWEGLRAGYRNALSRSMVYDDLKHIESWLQAVLGVDAPMASLPFRATPLLQMGVKQCKS